MGRGGRHGGRGLLPCQLRRGKRDGGVPRGRLLHRRRFVRRGRHRDLDEEARPIHRQRRRRRLGRRRRPSLEQRIHGRGSLVGNKRRRRRELRRGARFQDQSSRRARHRHRVQTQQDGRRRRGSAGGEVAACRTEAGPRHLCQDHGDGHHRENPGHVRMPCSS